MDLYLYSTFLVLMTTQSSLQYSFTFTQSHTHSYSASISSTSLFYEAQFGVQHPAQGHFGMQIFWEDWGSNCRRPLYPLSHNPYTCFEGFQISSAVEVCLVVMEVAAFNFFIQNTFQISWLKDLKKYTFNNRCVTVVSLVIIGNLSCFR